MTRTRAEVRTRWVLVTAAAVLAVALGTGLRGLPGLVAALIGIGSVAVFLLAGSIPARLEPVAGTAVAFALLATGYVLRVLLLLVLLLALRAESWVDSQVLGVTVVAAALVFTVAAIHAHRHSRTPIITLPPSDPR